MMYGIIKKIIAVIMSAVITFAVSGCGKKASSSVGMVENRDSQTLSESNDFSSTSDLSDGEINFRQDVAAIAGGEEIDKDYIGYYVYNNAVITINKVNEKEDSDNSSGSSSLAQDISEFNWNALDSNGKTYKDNVISSALDDAINDVVFRQMAEKCGYAVNNAKNEATKLINDSIETNGEEKFLSNAALLGICDAETYKNVYTNVAVFEGVAEEFYSSSEKYIDDMEILSDYIGTKGATVQSILITHDTSKGNADIIAREAAANANSGRDFVQVMKEYNEDRVENESGYTFPVGEMESDFEDTAFSLEIGEISNIINSDYGYYIIKRNPGAYELQNYWRSIADVSIAENAYDLINFDEVIERISTANLN